MMEVENCLNIKKDKIKGKSRQCSVHKDSCLFLCTNLDKVDSSLFKCAKCLIKDNQNSSDLVLIDDILMSDKNSQIDNWPFQSNQLKNLIDSLQDNSKEHALINDADIFFKQVISQIVDLIQAKQNSYKDKVNEIIDTKRKILEYYQDFSSNEKLKSLIQSQIEVNDEYHQQIIKLIKATYSNKEKYLNNLEQQCKNIEKARDLLRINHLTQIQQQIFESISNFDLLNSELNAYNLDFEQIPQIKIDNKAKFQHFLINPYPKDLYDFINNSMAQILERHQYILNFKLTNLNILQSDKIRISPTSKLKLELFSQENINGCIYSCKPLDKQYYYKMLLSVQLPRNTELNQNQIQFGIVSESELKTVGQQSLLKLIGFNVVRQNSQDEFVLKKKSENHKLVIDSEQLNAEIEIKICLRKQIFEYNFSNSQAEDKKQIQQAQINQGEQYHFVVQFQSNSSQKQIPIKSNSNSSIQSPKSNIQANIVTIQRLDIYK